MKKLIYGSILILLGAGTVMGVSAQTPRDGVINTNPANKNQTNVANSNNNSNSSKDFVVAYKPNSSYMTKDEVEVPSAYRYLIEYCELKNGFYYLPKEKFLELTEQQQNYVLTNIPKFKIKDSQTNQ